MGKLTRAEKRAAKKKQHLLEVKDSCVNCNQHIALDQRFCSHCGGKRIYNKLTWRNLIEDFIDRFLNLENSFFKTFIAMFKYPEDVIGGYMNGMRKKYLPAFSYFAIALTIAGVFGFLLKNYFIDDFIAAQIQPNTVFGNSPEQAALQKELADGWLRNYLNWVSEHQSLVYFALVPFLALLSRIVFWNYKKFNLVEHFVIYLYAYSHVAMITTTVGLLFIWSPILYQIIGLLTIPMMVLYIGWVLKRLFELDGSQIILKTGLFSLILSGLFFTLLIVTIATQMKSLMDGEKANNPFTIGLQMGFEKGRKKEEKRQKILDSVRLDSVLRATNSIKDTLEITPEMIKNMPQ